MKGIAVLLAGLLAVAPVAAVGQASDWRAPDPENVLVIDTNKGRIIAELSPQAAPKHVERIKVLTRRGFYDGLTFFRVINGFMAQTGDHLNTGEGDSDLPNLPIELEFRRSPADPFGAAPVRSGHAGFAGVLPVLTQPDAQAMLNADGKVSARPLFCAGVLGMARAREMDSGNSQFFLMRNTYPQLNHQYTAFGRVLVGLDVVRALKTGEPVRAPQDRMEKVRILADIPAAERPKVEVMDTRGPAFAELVAQAQRRSGANFDICALDIPARVQ